MSSREGFRERRRRKKASRDRLAEKTEMVRAEARELEQEKARAAEAERAEAQERARSRAREETEARKRAKTERRDRKEARKKRKKAGVKDPKRPKESLRARRKRRRGRRKGMSRGDRVALHRAQLEELWVWTKDVGRELRGRGSEAWAAGRRFAQPVTRPLGRVLRAVGSALMAVLRPLWRGIRAVLAPIAPYVAGALFLTLRGVAFLVRGLLDVTVAVLSWLRDTSVAVARAVARWVDAHVTAARTFAVLGALAAVALAASQFIDFREIAIGADQYEGEIQTVAPAPTVGQETPADAHSWVLLPIAALALPLIWLALRGRRRLALVVAAIGAAGIIVTLAIDLPQGLDTGRPGESYEGTEAHLIEGFWTQLFASLVLLGSGLGLAFYAGEGERSRPRRAAPETSTPPQRSGQAPGSAGWGGSGAGI